MEKKLTHRKMISSTWAQFAKQAPVPNAINDILQNFALYDPDWTTLKLEVSWTGNWDIQASVLYEEGEEEES